MLPPLKMYISRHKPTRSSYTHKPETSSYYVIDWVVNVQMQKHWYKLSIHKDLRLSAGVGFPNCKQKVATDSLNQDLISLLTCTDLLYPISHLIPKYTGMCCSDR